MSQGVCEPRRSKRELLVWAQGHRFRNVHSTPGLFNSLNPFVTEGTYDHVAAQRGEVARLDLKPLQVGRISVRHLAMTSKAG